MKKKLMIAAVFTAVAPTLFAEKLSMEEHTMQAVQQMQDANEKLGGTIVTVGDDVSCDFRLGTTRIQDAINAGNDEIRLAASTYDENLVIDDISVVIKGGYDNCTDAANDVTSGSNQLITGIPAASVPTISITGDSQRNNVTLERLQIEGGTSSGFFVGGGIFTTSADLALTIRNSFISSNTGSAGGGLGILNGNTDVVLFNTTIASNNATIGGGIYCTGVDASVFFNDDGGLSTLYNNQATGGDGGGALIEAGCLFTSYIGRSYPVGFLDIRGIVSNSATGNGGGIAVKSGARATLNGSVFCFPFLGCRGDNTRPANVDFNEADSDNNAEGFGGGVYASGENTVVNLWNTLISDNTAQSGGGVAVEDQATLNMRSLYIFGTCWRPGSCSELVENKTATSGFPVRGGGLYATTGAAVQISNTKIANNRANFGTALYTLAEDGDAAVTALDVEGSLIVNNGDSGADDWGDNDTIRINGGEVLLDYNTIADNALGFGANIHNTGSVEIFSSIIHNTDGTLVYRGDVQPNTTFPYECLMVNESGSLPTEPEIVVDDPEFVDRANGDFHLNAAISPAIDFCTTLNASTPDFNDSDNEARGFDDPLATNFQGPYDVGYDETYENDIIFEDDFED